MSAVAVVLAVAAPLGGPSIDTAPDLAPISLVEYVNTPDAPDPPPPIPDPVTVPPEAALPLEVAASVVTPKPPPPPPVVQQPVAQPGIDHADAIARARSAPNGAIPTDALCGLSFSSGLLRCDAAAALEAAVSDGMPAVELTSTYRSIADQRAVKAARGAWAAKPGTSNHGHAIAIDISGAAQDWLRANGPAYGWIWPDWARDKNREERWHFEYVG